MSNQSTGKTPTPANKQKGKKVCSCCHKEKNIIDFYSSNSPLYSLDKRVPICKDCVRDSCVSNETGEINEVELNIILRKIDKPFFKDDLASAYSQFSKEHSYIDEKDIKKYGDKILGLYFKNTMLRQSKDLSYEDSEKMAFIHTNSNTSISEKKKIVEKYLDIKSAGLEEENNIKQKQEEIIKWNSSDIKNKSYVLQTVGYDCFDDESYVDENKKFLYNTLADYLTDDVIEDPHKMQSVIALVKTTLQVENVDRLINRELKKTQPDKDLIKSLTDIKEKLSRTINSSANDNGISAKGSGKGSKGSNTLTNIMKEMAENGFEEIKTNIVNVKMSNSYKEISKENARALFDELNNTSDDYARMVATQAEMIDGYQTKITQLEEAIRLLKIENKALKVELDGDK